MSRKASPNPLATRQAYLFLAPALAVLGLFVLVPVAYAVVLSLASWNLAGDVKWVGLRNYQLLASDTTFWKSVGTTALYTLGSTGLGVSWALLLALLMNRKLPGIGAFRALLFVPAVISEVIVAMVFQWLYNTDYGPLNAMLAAVHLPRVPWLTSTTWALPAVVLMGAWVGAAYNAPILLTGLQSISPNLYEAAKLDGANPVQELRFLTLPLMRPFLLYVAVMAVIGSFQVFGRIYVLTGGGPVDATLMAVQVIYREAFQFNQIGYASALSVALFAILLALTVLQMKAFKRE